jgi:bisphosphoglycerate-independent phosphoglycerate mutase (AlkP superfamily)
VFNEISEHTEGTIVVNAGVEAFPSADPAVKAADRLQREVPTPWEGTRFDAFTFRLAMAHLAAAKPRVLYLAFDETDDWAHDGRYDRVLDAYARTDEFLKELWTWIQNEPSYRGRTHLLVTTDHGRGRTPKDWRDHGSRAEGSEDVWMAFVSPRMTQRGEWRGGPPLSTSQIAATLASWVGLDWAAEHPTAGKVVVGR